VIVADDQNDLPRVEMLISWWPMHYPEDQRCCWSAAELEGAPISEALGTFGFKQSGWVGAVQVLLQRQMPIRTH